MIFMFEQIAAAGAAKLAREKLDRALELAVFTAP
jgi:hypothetical protein